MSETETVKATLKAIHMHDNESLEDLCKRILVKELPDYYESYVEMMYDEEGYVIANHVLYQVVEREDFEFDDMFEATVAADGTIVCTLKYYNGGCSFEEAVEKALRDMPHEADK